jgi:prepilin-type N-terminal cleavage/methylation domain-containing protein
MRPHSKPAFTLLELLLVITLLSVLIALAWPDFSAASEGEQLQQSAQRMRALLAMCRAEAMNQTVRHQVLFRRDGRVCVKCQADALRAPHLYITPRSGWARVVVLSPEVWVEAVQVLPEGPPPIRIVDERLVFPETQIDPVPVVELERPIELNFEPDGTSNSLRWVLRDERGRALLATLDGRLGRVTIEPWTSVSQDELHRPERVPDEEEVEYVPEDHR